MLQEYTSPVQEDKNEPTESNHRECGTQREEEGSLCQDKKRSITQKKKEKKEAVEPYEPSENIK